MQITTVMVVMLIVWCLYTILSKGYQPVPFPIAAPISTSARKRWAG